MHTRVDILLKGDVSAESHLISVADEIHSLIHAIEVEGNCHNESSLLGKFNRLPVGDTLYGGKYLSEMLNLCKHYHTLSQGLFDITIDSVMHTTNTIDDILLFPDGSIGRQSENLKVNLSGFIKGYALDRIHQLLCEHKINDVIVNMGNSSILAMGNVPMHMKRRCLTTSGNTPGHRKQIVNPLDNKTINREGIVQVYTDSGTEGEVLATSFFVAEPSSECEKALLNRFTNVIVNSKSQ